MPILKQTQGFNFVMYHQKKRNILHDRYISKRQYLNCYRLNFIFHSFSKNTKKFKNLSYLDMNGTDVSVEVNLLAEAGLTHPADERPLFVVDRPDMLLQRALVGRRVLAERADEGFDIFVDVLDVSLLFADVIKLHHHYCY
jgi:hypothetical protein